MYRLTYISGRWLGIKMAVSDVEELFRSNLDDENSVDAQAVVDLVNQGGPTILVEDLDDLPADLEYEMI